MLKPVTLCPDITFVRIIEALVADEQDAGLLKTKDYIATFKYLFFNADDNYLMRDQIKDYLFLSTPLKIIEKSGSTSERHKEVYFKTPSAENCILYSFGLNRDRLSNFFYNVENFILGKEDKCERLFNIINADYAIHTIELLSQLSSGETPSEARYNEPYRPQYEELAEFFSVYIKLMNCKAHSRAIGLLLLYSVLNIDVIYLLEDIKSGVYYNSVPALVFDPSKKYVIGSTLSSNLLISLTNTTEPLDHLDKSNNAYNLLCTINRNSASYNESVFTIELIDGDEETEPAVIEPAAEERIAEAVLDVIGMDKAQRDKVIGQHAPKDKSNIKGMECYIKVNGQYLSWINWHRESRLIFGEKGAKSCWRLFLNNGVVSLRPSAPFPLNLFCIDIPNGCIKSYKLPLWLFPSNNSKAQQFYLYEVIE